MQGLFDDAKLTERIGTERFYPTVREAVAAVTAEPGA
jgi:hypothetical protein